MSSGSCLFFFCFIFLLLHPAPQRSIQALARAQAIPNLPEGYLIPSASPSPAAAADVETPDDATGTPSGSPSASAFPSESPSPSASVSLSPSASPSATPSVSISPSAPPSASALPSRAPPGPDGSPGPIPSPSNSRTPTPTPSRSRTPSPTPSATRSPTPTPTPSRTPSASAAAGNNDDASVSEPDDSAGSSADENAPSPTPTQPSGTTGATPASAPTQPPTPPRVTGVCDRDLLPPSPILGRSPLHSAACVLLSAVAISLASLLYRAGLDWQRRSRILVLRAVCIVFARLLLLLAIKVSAALVATITQVQAGGDDVAFDASSAFLTWGSAVFIRLYYEGVRMAFGVLTKTAEAPAIAAGLRAFLDVEIAPLEPDASGRLDSGAFSEPGAVITAEDSYAQRPLPGVSSARARGFSDPFTESNAEVDDDGAPLDTPTMRDFLMRGRRERVLILGMSVLYCVLEIAILGLNAGDLFRSLRPQTENARSGQLMMADSGTGQCGGFISKDIPFLVPIFVLDLVYWIANQASIIPLLIAGSEMKESKRVTVGIVLVLALWSGSLLTMPAFSHSLAPLFKTGDITLFWFVILSPPAYGYPAYILTVSYALLASVATVYILFVMKRAVKNT